MYKSTDSEQQQLCFLHFIQSCGLQLDTNNEWVKHADLLPWKAWEVPYAAMFPGIKGTVAKPCRMVMSSLIIQMRMGLTDRDLVKQTQENPYYQYFIGLEEFQHTPPFVPTLLVEWRKRINVDFTIKANDALGDAMPQSKGKSFGTRIINSGKTVRLFRTSGALNPLETVRFFLGANSGKTERQFRSSGTAKPFKTEHSMKPFVTYEQVSISEQIIIIS